MKINKWTLGLAAVGLVSLGSVVNAEEATSSVMTALSSTTLSGYVDVGAQWNIDNYKATGVPLQAGKNDGFNVNSVLLSLEKPLAEGEWSAGYRGDLQFGPDAVAINGDPTAGNENLRQAYVALRAPVGNGLDLKLGRWDTIIGYESADGYKNPNYTRSFGWGLEPTEHTGLLATYQALESLTVNAGIANTATTLGINTKAHNVSTRSESYKAYMASVAFTAPEDMGVLSGSALYAGIITGFGSATDSQKNYYVGSTIATPVEGLRIGASFDFVEDNAVTGDANDWAAALYASFKATDKASLHLRGEVADANSAKQYAVTATLQYDLWDNVISRLEARLDNKGDDNSLLLAANLIYKF